MIGASNVFHAEPRTESTRPALETLAWRPRSTSVCYVSECSRYEISVHHGYRGARYACSCFAGQPRRFHRIFKLRETLDEAFEDAQCHARTGEERP